MVPRQRKLYNFNAPDGFLINAVLVSGEFKNTKELYNSPIVLIVHGVLGHFLARGTPRLLPNALVERGISSLSKKKKDQRAWGDEDMRGSPFRRLRARYRRVCRRPPGGRLQKNLRPRLEPRGEHHRILPRPRRSQEREGDHTRRVLFVPPALTQ